MCLYLIQNPCVSFLCLQLPQTLDPAALRILLSSVRLVFRIFFSLNAPGLTPVRVALFVYVCARALLRAVNNELKCCYESFMGLCNGDEVDFRRLLVLFILYVL